MAFSLDQVVPWGRSFDEYAAMFALSDSDLRKSFLGCSDGPANFNCVLTQRGGLAVSADPLYHFTKKEIKDRITETYAKVMKQTSENQHEFVWDHIASVDELGKLRMNAMNDFLRDYTKGRKQGRYIEAALPFLPFKDRQFDIALCSHFLFLYSKQLSEDFHVLSIKELCRTASEARIFPLLELGSKRSRHLTAVTNRLRKDGFVVKIERVAYEFQKNGNEMLKVSTID